MYLTLDRYWDPLYGRAAFSPFERELIYSPEVQRLRHIRLCNINSLLVPGASEINRFEHSLGVLRLANEWLSRNQLPKDEANDLRAAALLHDVQTGPFGHSFEYILEDNEFEGEFEHEDLIKGKEEMYYQDLMANASFAGAPFEAAAICGDRWDRVSDLIKGNGPLGTLITGTMDLDNIDNVIRLAFHSGIADHSDGEMAINLVRDLAISESKLTFSSQSIPLIEKWQLIRHRLYELLLLDWAEFSAKAMLTRAFEEAAKYDLVGTDSWRLADDELLFDLQHQSIGESQIVKNLFRRLRLGDLYTPFLLIRTPNGDVYDKVSKREMKRRLEKQIRNTIYPNETGRDVLLHTIRDYRKTDRAVPIVVKETNEHLTVGNDSRTLLIGIFLSTPPTMREKKELREIALKALKSQGLQDFEDIVDPMGNDTITDSQMNLF